MTLPAVSWTVDGIPTPLTGWSSTTVAFGGYGQMRGTIRETDARRIPTSVTQGSLVKGFTDGGTIVFEGRLSAPPVIRGGLASFAAQGESVRAAKRNTELLYQDRDVGHFFDRSGPPLNNLETTTLSLSIEAGRLLWSENDGAAAASTDHRSAGYWTQSPGGISRVAFTHKASAAGSRQYEIYRTSSFPADTGYTLVSTFAEATSDTARDTGVIGTPESGIIFQRRFIASGTYGEGRAHAFNIRVNGIATGDTYTGSQVVADVGQRLGYDTSAVPTTSLNILPLYWTSGSWAELLSYIAILEDRYWGVYEDGKLKYPAWGDKEWTVYQADGATVDLTPLELYNQVTVKYVDVGGAPREVTIECGDVGITDPLASTGIVNVWEESLSDVQPDSTLATAVASNLIPRVCSLREAGRIDCVKAYDSTGREAVREIRAGDVVIVADRDMNTATHHRVFETDQDDNSVSLGIEGAVSIASLLGQAGLAAARAPSTAQLPEIEPKAPEPSGIPSEEEQHRARFLPWPEPFKKPAWRKIRPLNPPSG